MRREELLRGRCLCGEVSYEAAGPAGEMWYCHCRACSKASGVGFGTWIEAPGIRWLTGEACVTRFAASQALMRSFCARCGTVLPALRTAGGALLPAGGLDSVGGRQPRCHAFVIEHAPWLPICGEELPAFAGPRSKGATQAGFAANAAPPRPAGAPVRGSCLCGAIAFAIVPPLFAMRVCHCTRCRRRSGSNGFAGLACGSGSLQLLRGEECVRSWHMPGTRFYEGHFCATCGTPAPAVLGHGTFIAAGSLDDDPGIRVRCHIYYGSRAPWVNVADGLPRFEEFTPPGFDWRATGAAPGAGD